MRAAERPPQEEDEEEEGGRRPAPLSRAASELPRSAGSSEHLRACLWHWQRLEGMEGFIFGNLPLLCLFDADIPPPPPEDTARPPSLGEETFQQHPLWQRETNYNREALTPAWPGDPSAACPGPACSPLRPVRSEPPAPAAAGSARGLWSSPEQPGCGVHGAGDTDAGGIHRRPPAAGDFWSCIGCISPLAGLDRISEEKGMAMGRALFAIPPWLRSSQIPSNPAQGFILLLVLVQARKGPT